MDNYAKRRAGESLKSLQWEVRTMMTLTPQQRRAIDGAVRALEENPMLDSLRAWLPAGHPLK